MRKLRQITGASSIWKAFSLVWHAGLEAHEQGLTIEELKRKGARLAEENLSLSQLVHDYETKIHNVVRGDKELAKQNKELERAYRALRIENQWLKEEIFKLKDKPAP